MACFAGLPGEKISLAKLEHVSTACKVDSEQKQGSLIKLGQIEDLFLS